MIWIIYVVVFLWLVRIVTNVLSYIHLWYVKEYRWDRMRIHLGTPQGKRILFLPFRPPPLTPKTFVLFWATLIILELIYVSLPRTSILLKLAVIDLLTFPVVSVIVWVLKIPTQLYHAYKIRRAIHLLRLHKPMRVIGITGSFGKTSTKEYLATILSSKYKVLKTSDSKNSPIGIAEVILGQLKPEHEIFIVEMGAYKKGEIAEMCHMVNPQIGIVTAINPQHQDLFGSIETTMQAKYELINGLPKDGIAIFNADNEKTLEMAQWAKREGKLVWVYAKEGKKLSNVDQIIRARNVETKLDSVSFDVIMGKQRANVEANVLGEHQVSNILAAILAANAVGMNLEQAAKTAGNIRPFTKIMQQVKGVNSALFINDTFNNNPDAAKVAIDYLAQTKGRKILVFQPMIELGEYADSAHWEVGEAAAKVCDEIYVTNATYIDAITAGVQSVNKNKQVVALPAKAVAARIKKQVTGGDTVLFKGKEAGYILRLLVK